MMPCHTSDLIQLNFCPLAEKVMEVWKEVQNEGTFSLIISGSCGRAIVKQMSTTRMEGMTQSHGWEEGEEGIRFKPEMPHPCVLNEVVDWIQ